MTWVAWVKDKRQVVKAKMRKMSKIARKTTLTEAMLARIDSYRFRWRKDEQKDVKCFRRKEGHYSIMNASALAMLNAIAHYFIKSS